LRYGAYIQSFFDNVESNRSLIVDHDAEKSLDVLTSIVRRRITIPGIATWWRENTGDYDADFVAWIEKLHGDT
jgi:hypothetical protein